jgi:hypothetical protein
VKILSEKVKKNGLTFSKPIASLPSLTICTSPTVVHNHKQSLRKYLEIISNCRLLVNLPWNLRMSSGEHLAEVRPSAVGLSQAICQTIS